MYFVQIYYEKPLKQYDKVTKKPGLRKSTIYNMYPNFDIFKIMDTKYGNAVIENINTYIIK